MPEETKSQVQGLIPLGQYFVHPNLYLLASTRTHHHTSVETHKKIFLDGKGICFAS